MNVFQKSGIMVQRALQTTVLPLSYPDPVTPIAADVKKTKSCGSFMSQTET